MSSFTPDTALLGGAAAGAAVGLKLLTVGRPVAIADDVGGLLAGKKDTWRWVSLGGVAAGAALVAWKAPGFFERLPSSYTLTRAGLAGAAVGAGTALGGGGHGVSGLARASVKSLAFVGASLAAGLAAAPLSGAIDALGLTGSGTARAVGPSDATVTAGAATLAAVVGGGALLALAAKKTSADKQALEHAAEAASSTALVAGLGAAGLLSPSRVVAFFAPAAGLWDPTLAFAVGGALLVAGPATYYALKKASGTLLGGSVEAGDDSTDIDAKLLGGAALYGAGLAAGGITPLSGLAALVGTTAAAPYAVWTAAFLASRVAVAKALEA